MTKTYVLDTNVLADNPNILDSLSGNIVVPTIVIKELDGLKVRGDEVGRNARYVSSKIDELRTDDNNLSDGVVMNNGYTLRVINSGEPIDNNDNYIINFASELSKNEEVILLSKDTNVRITAGSMGVIARDYTDSTSFNEDTIYKGWREIELSPDRIDSFYANGHISVRHKLYPNEFVIMKDECGTNKSAIARYDAVNKELIKLRYHEKELFGSIKARNVEQRFAIELLLDDSIKLVTFIGRAGGGKTLISLAAGLKCVIEEGRYRKMLISRSTTPHGEDIGFLPGNIEEKMLPWLQGMYDNLEFLIDGMSDVCYKDGEAITLDIRDIFNDRVQIMPLTYIRGRSLPERWILIDEAQNLSKAQIKTLVTRAGENTKIILTGDIEQIDHPHLDQYNNGLTYLINRFKGQQIYGHVTMNKTERSDLAEIASRLL